MVTLPARDIQRQQARPYKASTCGNNIAHHCRCCMPTAISRMIAPAGSSATRRCSGGASQPLPSLRDAWTAVAAACLDITSANRRTAPASKATKALPVLYSRCQSIGDGPLPLSLQLQLPPLIAVPAAAAVHHCPYPYSCSCRSPLALSIAMTSPADTFSLCKLSTIFEPKS